MSEYFLNNILVWTRYNPTLALVLCKTSKVVPFTVAGPRRQTSLREFSPNFTSRPRHPLQCDDGQLR